MHVDSGDPVYGDEEGTKESACALERPNGHNAGETGRALAFDFRAYVPSLLERFFDLHSLFS